MARHITTDLSSRVHATRGLLGAGAFIVVVALAAGPQAAGASAAPCAGGIVGTGAGEQLVGTAGDDRINGGGGRDTLSGLAGNDCVAGGSKDDRIDPGSGADLVLAGGGRDVVKLDDGAVDTLDCGSQRDTVTADAGDQLNGCERVTRVEPPPVSSGTDPDPAPPPTSEPPPPADTTAPETTINSGPSGTISSGSASFSFSASEGGSSFQCSLDNAAWAACTSPKALSGLGNGGHSFAVRATDAAGNVDPSPAARTFSVALPAPPPAASPCAFVEIASCTVLKRDDGTATDPQSLWGSTIYCADPTRQQVVDGFRRLTVVDGDDVWGERCELGNNEHRFGESGTQGTFQLYPEGSRKITMMRVRLGQSFPLNGDWTWQLIAQMKQAQPADNGGGTPALSLQAVAGKWRLQQSSSSGPSSSTQELWATPAQKSVWTQIAFDVTYSQDPSVGRIQLFIDTNGDGDALDAGERSPVIQTWTLKRETATNSADGMTNDGIAEGQSIPSHLRMGVYHDSAFACPPPGGCSVDYDDIVVARPG